MSDSNGNPVTYGMRLTDLTAEEAAALPIGAVVVEDEWLFVKVPIQDDERDYYQWVPPGTKTVWWSCERVIGHEFTDAKAAADGVYVALPVGQEQP